MDFYFDENLPERVARALNELEGKQSSINVYSTVDKWEKGIQDPDLIVLLSKVNGIWVTNDKKLRTRIEHFKLIKRQNITVIIICFASGSDYVTKYQRIVKVWEKIKKTCREKEKSAFIAKFGINTKRIDYY